MNNIKWFIKRNFLSLVLSIGTIVYGVELLLKTETFDRFSIYNQIQPYLTSIHIGVILIVVGSFKLIAMLIDNFKLRRIALTILIFTWSFFAISFIFSEPRNIVSVYSTMLALFSLGISFRSEGDI